MLYSPSTDYLLGLASGQARVNGCGAVEGMVAKLTTALDGSSGPRSHNEVVRDQDSQPTTVDVNALVGTRKDEVVVDAEAPGGGDTSVDHDARRVTRNLVVLDGTLDGIDVSTTRAVDTGSVGTPDVAVPNDRTLQRAALDAVGHVLVGSDDTVLNEIVVTELARRQADGRDRLGAEDVQAGNVVAIALDTYHTIGIVHSTVIVDAHTVVLARTTVSQPDDVDTKQLVLVVGVEDDLLVVLAGCNEDPGTVVPRADAGSSAVGFLATGRVDALSDGLEGAIRGETIMSRVITNAVIHEERLGGKAKLSRVQLSDDGFPNLLIRLAASQAETHHCVSGHSRTSSSPPSPQ